MKEPGAPLGAKGGKEGGVAEPPAALGGNGGLYGGSVCSARSLS